MVLVLHSTVTQPRIGIIIMEQFQCQHMEAPYRGKIYLEKQANLACVQKQAGCINLRITNSLLIKYLKYKNQGNGKMGNLGITVI
jgi:hypothetical protein